VSCVLARIRHDFMTGVSSLRISMTNLFDKIVETKRMLNESKRRNFGTY